MQKSGYLLILIFLLCGSTLWSSTGPISYTIKVASTGVNEEVNVSVQEHDLDGDGETMMTKRMTPFEISAEAGVFNGVFTRLSGATEIQVDVYCEGCKEARVLYGHGTQVSMRLKGDARTFEVQR